MGQRILLVEDEPGLVMTLSDRLEGEGYTVESATDGESGLAKASTGNYDLILLDVMLPRKSGLDVCRTFRADGASVPILMLTARDWVEARVEGLDCGADDYLTKPFAFDELLARLRALLRRGERPVLPERLRVADLEIDTRGRHVTKRGRPVPLTAKEYALLEYLARRPGHVVGRAEIAEHVWDESYDAFSNVIEVYVRRLRSKIDDPGALSLIRTRRGEGYELAATGAAPETS